MFIHSLLRCVKHDNEEFGTGATRHRDSYNLMLYTMHIKQLNVARFISRPRCAASNTLTYYNNYTGNCLPSVAPVAVVYNNISFAL